MTNAINDLRLRWRARQEGLNKQIGAAPGGFNRAVLTAERDAIHTCVTELLDTVGGVTPLPLNEASTEKLYRWAPRMVQVLDLMQEARRGPDPYDPPALAAIAEKLGDLADRPFMTDIYDLFKQLANRGRTY